MMLILNRDFRLPEDGFYQLAPLGEFPHEAAGIVQVIDREACEAMAALFAADAAKENFAGVLIDFDHFSLDVGQRSEAAGWITNLEARPDGLFAKIRWSDVGQAAVEGGRYRFLSPVWAKADCVELGGNRVRPVRLLNAAVTNDPNLKGMLPLSNRGRQAEDLKAGPVDLSPTCRGSERTPDEGKEKTMKTVIEKLVNHLGLAADASETSVLAAMKALPTVAAHAELQNSLRELQGKHDALVTDVGRLEQELVNRHLTEFEGVITESAKAFWSEQLLANREAALAVLGDLKKSAEAAAPAEAAGAATAEPAAGGTRKPLHNRAAARPVQPGQKPEADGKAVKIRNRAHEIAKAEGIPFSVAFRRAEKELVGQ